MSFTFAINLGSIKKLDELVSTTTTKPAKLSDDSTMHDVNTNTTLPTYKPAISYPKL